MCGRHRASLEKVFKVNVSRYWVVTVSPTVRAHYALPISPKDPGNLFVPEPAVQSGA